MFYDVVCDCQRDSSQSKVIVFLSTQDSVEFHYLLLSECLRTSAADAATDAQLQLFKLHGDLPQKVNLHYSLDFDTSAFQVAVAV